MAVHLTRIYTKTGDDGTTALGDMSRVAQDRPAARGVRRRRRGQQRDRGGARAGRAAEPTSPRCCGRSRTTCSTSAPTSARRSTPDPEYPPLRVTAGVHRRGWRRRATATTPSWTKLTASSCPAVRRGRRCCTSPARSSAGRSARSGRCSRPTPRRTNRGAGAATSTGSPTCCSSWPGCANPDGDVLWQPGGNDERIRHQGRPVAADDGARAVVRGEPPRIDRQIEDVRGWLGQQGKVFAEFLRQDSGCRAYGVEVQGERWFVKHAVEPRAMASVTFRRASSSSRTRAAPHDHRTAWTPCPPHSVPLSSTRGGTAASLYPATTDPEAPHARFRRLPLPEVLRAIDDLFDAHIAICAAGFVAVDLYDGCFLLRLRSATHAAL